MNNRLTKLLQVHIPWSLLCLLAILTVDVVHGQRVQQPQQKIVVATVSANYREGLTLLARQYERLHPGVDVQIVIQPSEGYETWLRTQVASGSSAAPDLYNANYAAGFYERGLMFNMAGFLPQTNPYTDRPWRDDLDMQFVEKYKLGGDVVQMPVDFVEIAFFYNKDIFKDLGLQPPRTWEEMLEQGRLMQSKGLIAFSIAGDATAFWTGPVGWIFRFVTDAYMRDKVPIVASQPGDWDYDPRLNESYTDEFSDPYNDATVVLNMERVLAAVRDGEIRFDSDRFREAYEIIKDFARYWQPGFNGTSPISAYQLFLTQKAAVMIGISSTISVLNKDMDDLYPKDRFEWGVFAIPPLENSRHDIPPFRGVGGAGLTWGIMKKDPIQNERAVDFLMFITTPEAARILVSEAVKARQPLTGPMLISGAELPPSIERHFEAFRNRGFEKLSFRGLMDEQESVWKWTVLAQQYLDGRLTVDECLSRYQEVMEEAAPRMIETMNYDMDPQTKDTE